MNFLNIFKIFSSELELVEEKIDDFLKGDLKVLNRVNNYILSSKGKRLRPILLLLTSKILGNDSDIRYKLAAIVELIHTATLVHDDIIDNSEVRRGNPSVNNMFGNQISVLAGDWIYMTCFNLALLERNFDILDILMEVTLKMVEGELLQLDLIGNVDITIDETLEIAKRKTAYLFSTAMKLGVIGGEYDGDLLSKLGEIGINMGLSFQLQDDILDYIADEKNLGKPKMRDLLEGKVTLPLILLLKKRGTDLRGKIKKVMEEKKYHVISRDELLSLLVKEGALEESRNIARNYGEKAISLASTLPENKYRDMLIEIANFIVNRDR